MYEVYEVEGGWGCRVIFEDSEIEQNYHPYKSAGFPMTKEEAVIFGEAVSNGLELPFELPPPLEIPEPQDGKSQEQQSIEQLEEWNAGLLLQNAMQDMSIAALQAASDENEELNAEMMFKIAMLEVGANV